MAKCKTGLLALLLAMLCTMLITCYGVVPPAIVSVEPKESRVKVNDIFTVNVTVANVSELTGFDFCLSYNTAILSLLKVEEGPFMKSVGNTFMINLTSEGLVWFVLVIYHPEGLSISANGSGVLAILTFKAIAVGESCLDLHSINPYRSDQVKLAKGCDQVEPIPNVAYDGFVIVSQKTGNPHPTPPPPSDPPEDPPEKSIDVNGDGKVNIKDLTIVAKAFGSYPGHPNWNEKADLDNNEKVDIIDVSMVALNFGTSI